MKTESEFDPAASATSIVGVSEPPATPSLVEAHVVEAHVVEPNVGEANVAEHHVAEHHVAEEHVAEPRVDAANIDAANIEETNIDAANAAGAHVTEAPVAQALGGAALDGESLAGESLGGESLGGESLAGETLVDETVVGEALLGETFVAPQPGAGAPVPGPASADAAGAPPVAEPAAKAPKKPVNEELRRRAQQAWENVTNAKASGASVSGFVTAAVKGGLLVDVGSIRGFLPASQVRVPKDAPIESLVRTKVPLKVLDTDQARRRVVVSHRRALDDERRRKRDEVLGSLAIGQVRDVVVVRLADFGAFVDLGGIDGLIPMSELALERIEKASDAVAIGDRFPATVLRIDEGGRKIALSRKSALPDPWRDHAALLRGGTTIEGKVVAKEPRLVVEIADGVTGSVRANDADPADYEIGESIEVVVRSVDRRTRRITLALPYAGSVQATSSGFAPLGEELLRKRR